MSTQVLSSRWAQAGLAAVAVTAVLVAPLATKTTGKAGAVTISGARSLSDQVSVKFASVSGRTTDVHLLAYNDFHGTLDPAGQTLYGDFAGGGAYLAKAVKDKQAQYGAREATVFAGDGIGASQLANGLFHEEPSTIIANLMHTDFASVGNHEFDKGSAELLRIQNGGCNAADNCAAAPYALADGGSTDTFPGADFQYLSANVVVDATGRTLFPAYGIKRFPTTLGNHKVAVGFIGEVLKDTPTIVTPTGVAGLTFQDEADAANRAVAKLRAQGVNTNVLVIHQGGFQTAPTLNGCGGNLAGSPIVDIAQRLDPSVKVIISAHTHAEYRCTITTNGVTRLITSASSFGRVLSDITLQVKDTNGELVSAAATNVLVKNALNKPGAGITRVADPSLADPTVAAVVSQYVAAAAPLANKIIGKVQGDLTRTASPLGESALGDVIADAQYEATKATTLGGAQLAFMNPGGIRADILASDVSSGGEAVGEVTYGEAFTVQPFGNSLVTKTMTGDQIHRVLEQQFGGCGGQTAPKTLQISRTLKYESNPAAATCAAKIGRIWVNGVLVNPTDTFRVTMNNFIAAGGDGFTVFNEGTSSLGGAQDIDALIDYFAANASAGIAVPALDRIVTPTP